MTIVNGRVVSHYSLTNDWCGMELPGTPKNGERRASAFQRIDLLRATLVI